MPAPARPAPRRPVSAGPAPAGKVLLVGCFAEPEAIGMNRLLAVQAQELRRAGVDVEVLTWPHGDGWRGPVPDEGCDRLAGMPYLRLTRSGVPYHVVRLPPIWAERVTTDAEWAAAVAWARDALETLRPDVVHQHYWQQLWWTMEAATELGLPTLYTAYDYGVACLRTILVKGDDTLCDARPGPGVCEPCIVSGRDALGKLNEAAARAPLGPRLLSLGFGAQAGGPLARRGGVRLPVEQRVGATLARCRRVFPRLSAVITKSPFSRDFFVHLGARPEAVRVWPWFYDDAVPVAPEPPREPPLVLGFCGRVSPEKGVHVLLEALARVPADAPVELRIAGNRPNAYVDDLRARYPDHAGPHRVRWLGWFDARRLDLFYAEVHAAVVPSLWYDNCPAALVEALSQRRAALVTDVPSMSYLVEPGVAGWRVPMGDVPAWTRAIEQAARDLPLTRAMGQRAAALRSGAEYAIDLRDLYRSLG